MKALPKIIATGICMLVLCITSFIVSHNVTGILWKAILLWPVSVSAWALLLDAYIGIAFHGNLFYMSENTWPDKVILRFAQNGYLYTFFKIIAVIFFSGLLRYFN